MRENKDDNTLHVDRTVLPMRLVLHNDDDSQAAPKVRYVLRWTRNGKLVLNKDDSVPTKRR